MKRWSEHYRVNARKSADALARRWKHLKGYFGNTVAQNVTTELLEEYVDSRNPRRRGQCDREP